MGKKYEVVCKRFTYDKKNKSTIGCRIKLGKSRIGWVDIENDIVRVQGDLIIEDYT